jgi:hypothetical protein
VAAVAAAVVEAVEAVASAAAETAAMIDAVTKPIQSKTKLQKNEPALIVGLVRCI